MIAFSSLGYYGRLGNQLFQYAFLRASAETLTVQFYCPSWSGDDIFDLNDKKIRSVKPTGKNFTQAIEDTRHVGFSGLVPIADWHDYRGYFASPRYFSGFDVRKWYTFKPIKNTRCLDLAERIESIPTVGLHLRFGDFTILPDFYNPKRSYYLTAIEQLPSTTQIVVFSDNHIAARKLLGRLPRPALHAESMPAGEDLYLMSRCLHFVCSSSTFSWWGAYLREPGKGTTFFPRDGFSRPGTPRYHKDAFPEEWISLASGLGVLDRYAVRKAWLSVRYHIAVCTGPVRHWIRDRKQP